MKIEHLVSIVLSTKDIKDAVACRIGMHANEYVPGTPEFERLTQMEQAVRQNYCSVELDNKGDVVFLIDGVSYVEELTLEEEEEEELELEEEEEDFFPDLAPCALPSLKLSK